MLGQELKKFIQNHENIIFLCIGNEMRGDDAAGPIIAKKLGQEIQRHPDKYPRVSVVNTGTVPENYTGMIRSKQPSHIIFVDAVEMDLDPGSLRLVHQDEIASYSISTHAMPLSFMIKYLKSFSDAEIILIGIQPKSMEMFEEISEELKEGIESLMIELIRIFQCQDP
ncbi:MAG: hydrogenase maturation peptidase HycI [Methanobacterium sp. ERen5]|nr:MAG: hydrogenase maturation peptidase HycI [Methanobacterium sp. ERen5]